MYKIEIIFTLLYFYLLLLTDVGCPREHGWFPGTAWGTATFPYPTKKRKGGDEGYLYSILT